MSWEQNISRRPVRGRFRSVLAVILLLVLDLLYPGPASGQYDWRPHLGPVPTGFELIRFGTWDLEVMPLRGMVDRGYYESDEFHGLRIRKIVETTRSSTTGEKAGSMFRQSTTHLDRQGRITRIEYADPLTRKVAQRESFLYDNDGRLVSWRRARPPSEVSIASVTQTLYPGRGPYGMSQSFSYDEVGTLREWRACTISVEQHLESCEEDYLVLDAAGRIIEYGTTGTHYLITRNKNGNAVRIEVRGSDGELTGRFAIAVEDRTIAENPVDDSLKVGNYGWLDEDGRMIQYRVSSSETPDYYWTATWTYDGKGRPLNVQKGFDTYEFKYDAAGRLISIKQSLNPQSIFRTFDSHGRIHSQEPPLFYARMDAGLEGEERYTYDDKGFLSRIFVRNSSGMEVAETEMSYIGRGSD